MVFSRWREPTAPAAMLAAAADRGWVQVLWRVTAGPRKGAERWRALLDAAVLARRVLTESAAARR